MLSWLLLDEIPFHPYNGRTWASSNLVSETDLKTHEANQYSMSLILTPSLPSQMNIIVDQTQSICYQACDSTMWTWADLSIQNEGDSIKLHSWRKKINAESTWNINVTWVQPICRTTLETCTHPKSDPSYYFTDHVSTSLLVNLTISGPFSQSRKTFWFIQPSLLGSNSISKFHTILAKMHLISPYAKFLPRQLRGPVEKGWLPSRMSFA